MNKKGNILIEAAVFVVLWIVCSMIWSIWLDGIMNPIAGLITAGVFFVATKITFNR